MWVYAIILCARTCALCSRARMINLIGFTELSIQNVYFILYNITKCIQLMFYGNEQIIFFKKKMVNERTSI